MTRREPRNSLTDQEMAFRRTLLAWHRRHRRTFPWRTSRSRYEVLVGELMLQRTRGEHVPPVYEDFLQKWPTPRALATADVSAIADAIRPLGLAKRAETIAAMAAVLNGRDVPSEPAELMKLPGVGPYVSHAVPVFADGRSLPLVDWVIARVLRRVFGLPEERRPNADKELWELASRLAAKGAARSLWAGVLDLAAAVCRPRPLCPDCPARSFCVTGRSQQLGTPPD